MAGSMQFDLVSPERSLASLQATEVQIPGADGDMTAMPDHSPTLTTLRPGVLVVKADGAAEQSYVVTGGFAEISPAGVSILAERALPKADVTADDIASMIEAAESVAAGKPANERDAANKTVADIRALGATLGF